MRILGVATELVWLASVNAYVPYVLDEKTSHPPCYDRLFQALSAFVDDNHHLVWGMVAVILALHVGNRGPKCDDTVKHVSVKAEAQLFVRPAFTYFRRVAFGLFRSGFCGSGVI